MSEKFKRRNDMDALRAIAMLLGIAFHIALAYTGKGWFISDSQNSKFFAWLCDSSHGFRMPLFFVLSGFFTAMLWKKRGLKKLLAHRFKRIFLPCLVAVFTFGAANGLAIWYIMQDNNSSPAESELTAVNDSIELQKKLHGFPTWTLVLSSHEGQALTFSEDFQFPPHGIGSNITLGDSSQAAKIVFDGQVIRKADEPIKAFEVSFEKFTQESTVTCWYSNGNTERAHKWQVNSDYTLSPLRAKHLVLGWDNSLKLVKIGDSRQLTFTNLPEPVVTASTPEVHENSSILNSYYEVIRTPPFNGQILGHMWFLWFLCWLVILFAVFATIWRKLKLQIPDKMISLPYCLLWLIPLTYLPQSIMHFGESNFGPDTSIDILPYPHTLFYYTIFFGFGALLFERDGSKPQSPRRGWFLFCVSLFILFPLWSRENSNKVLMDLLQVSYTWIMTFAWIDLFRYYCSRESKLMRYISDASYWMYLAHMPLVFLGQHWARHWQTNAFVKFTIVNTTMFAILLVSYHLLVRSTPIGIFLNGKRCPFFKKNHSEELESPEINDNEIAKLEN